MQNKMVIFDLDGTLIDTSPGIFGSVRYAEQQLNLKPIADSDLKKFVGPPPKDMYKKIYNLSEHDAIRATEAHRKYGMEQAIYEAKTYNGIPEVLCELKKRSFNLAVATLKRQKIAEVILNRFTLDKYFDVIVGMDDEETFTKEDTIRKAMEYVGLSDAVMVGDSKYDYHGALEAGVDFIGALYGFGFKNGEDYSFKTISKPIDLLDRLLM